MSSMLFQLPYRESREGYWGEPTSTLNWCEEDYNLTYYCAEVINTFTNLIFVWLALKGIRNVVTHEHPRVFIVAFLGYLAVGLGSMAFHTSLKYSMQLADELPMIYTVCIMGFATFSYNKSVRASILVANTFGGVAWFITAYYLYAKNPVFHQVSFVLVILSTFLRCFYSMAYQLRPALEKRNPAECDAIMSRMWALAWTGTLLFVTGFFVWRIDTIFCRQLTGVKEYLLLPWAFLLEGHGWWHILTGLAYHMIIWRIWLHRCLDGSEDEFMLKWPKLGTSIPEVVPRPGKAHSGADSKKAR